MSTPENYETNAQDEKPYYSQKNQGQDYLPLPTNYYPPSDNTPNNQYPPSNQTHYPPSDYNVNDQLKNTNEGFDTPY